MSPTELEYLSRQLKNQAQIQGFQQLGISAIELGTAEQRLFTWLAQGYHGEMDYMAKHGLKRSRPAELLPGTVRVISARMDYFPPAADAIAVLDNPKLAYIARYALGRDYHKVLRKRLQTLVDWLRQTAPEGLYRVYCDSAPVLEKPLAQQAGLGWIGKHTNLINQHAGSWFFLGEIYTDLPLPPDPPATAHCGSCTRCIRICPTAAIVAPYQLDARRCIAYLTIELRGAIPVEFRPLIGNRVYGCDDCQLVCPWNRYAQLSKEADFFPRQGLDSTELLTLWRWSAAEFNQRLQGSPILRIGYECWLRNLAVALGNAPYSAEIVTALAARQDDPSELVREHVAWALAQQQGW